MAKDTPTPTTTPTADTLLENFKTAVMESNHQFKSQIETLINSIDSYLRIK